MIPFIAECICIINTRILSCALVIYIYSFFIRSITCAQTQPAGCFATETSEFDIWKARKQHSDNYYLFNLGKLYNYNAARSASDGDSVLSDSYRVVTDGFHFMIVHIKAFQAVWRRAILRRQPKYILSLTRYPSPFWVQAVSQAARSPRTMFSRGIGG